MFCPVCGTETPENANYCHYCGAATGPAEPAHRDSPGHPDAKTKSDALYAEGVELVRKRHLSGAMERFDEVLLLDPGNAPAWNAKAVVLDLQGDTLHAFQCVENAIRISPDNRKYRANHLALEKKIKQGGGYRPGPPRDADRYRHDDFPRTVPHGRDSREGGSGGRLLKVVIAIGFILLLLGSVSLVFLPHPPGEPSAGIPPAGQETIRPAGTTVATPAPGHVSIPENRVTVLTTTQKPALATEEGGIRREFEYVLRGKKDTVPFSLDNKTYLSLKSLDPYIYVGEENGFNKFIGNPEQDTALKPIVAAIRNKTPVRDDQARIAISLVQNIPYDYDLLESKSPRVRYPYLVLFNNRGICSEKSLLAAYLLKELGYGVVLFRFDQESHMAVGVRSPGEYSYRGTGYAFVETTTPTILTDDQEDYIGAGRLTSMPEVVLISDGQSFSSISEEFRDRNEWIAIMEKSKTNNNSLDPASYTSWKRLVAQYGIQVGRSRDQNTPLVDVEDSSVTSSSTGDGDRDDALFVNAADREFIDRVFGKTDNGHISTISHDYSWALETLRNRNYDQAKVFLDKLDEDCEEAVKTGSLGVSPGLASQRDEFVSAVRTIRKGSSDLYKAVNAYSYGSDSDEYFSSARTELSDGFSRLNDFILEMDRRGYVRLA